MDKLIAERIITLLDLSVLAAAVVQWLAFGFAGMPQHDRVHMGLVVYTAMPLIGLTLSRLLQGRSEAPRRAMLRLITCISILVCQFSAVYYSMGTTSNFNIRLTRVDALYFTLTTFSTVGFGDVYAKSQGARLAVSIQITLDTLLVVVAIAVAVGRASAPVPPVKRA